MFNNAFLKRESSYFQFRTIRVSFFKYFFISIILVLGLFFGFFSIFNGIYNLLNYGLTEWINKENILGILPLRISSVLILTYLINYIYRKVLNNNLKGFLKLGILPIRIDGENSSRSVVDLNNKETLFFCQISFYVINLALAEIFIIYNYQSTYLSVLNFSILFIVDDFKLIDDYVRQFRRILKLHFLRLCLFNLVMLISSFVILLNHKFYSVLAGYVLIVAILIYYYLKNLHHYRVSDYY